MGPEATETSLLFCRITDRKAYMECCTGTKFAIGDEFAAVCPNNAQTYRQSEARAVLALRGVKRFKYAI